MELNVGKDSSTVQFFSIRRKTGAFAAGDDRKKRLFLMDPPIEASARLLSPNCGYKLELPNRGVVERPIKEEESASNCLWPTVNWPTLIGRSFQAFPASVKNSAHKEGDEHNDKVWMSSRRDVSVSFNVNETDMKGLFVQTSLNEDTECEVGNISPLKCLIGSMFDQLVHNVQKFNQGLHGDGSNEYSCNVLSEKGHFKGVGHIQDGRNADVGGFIKSLRFAKVLRVSLNVVEVSSVKEEKEDGTPSGNREAIGDNSKHEITAGMLDMPLSNVECFTSKLSIVALTDIEHVPQLGQTLRDHPDKSKLFLVQDFFSYTESEGKRFFEELDRDGDGQVTLADLEVATGKRKLPKKYAQELMQHNRPHIFSKSFGWKQFLSSMEEKEPTILRAYISFRLTGPGFCKRVKS